MHSHPRSREAICPSCGARNRVAAKFCIGCVGPLVGARAVAPDASEAPTIVQTRREAAEKGWERTTAVARQSLPEGTTLEGFQILRPLGEGGFGIVYLAWDSVLERHVAIKEYMPSALALRGENSLAVSMRSEQHRSTFEAGLKSFLNEARLLAKFDHPALLKVFRFWEAHGTAYMAMPYYEGPTLKEVLAGESDVPSETQLREWLHPLLDALAVIHRENCLHRDISPDNILLTSTGPVLLDFGAARRVISDMTQSLTAVLKPGFAPIEQYGGVMNQGPWTDLYALAGVVYYAITGQLPPASAARVVSDGFKPLGETNAGRYTDRFLRAIDATLSLRPEARPQDAAQFRALIDPLPLKELPSASASASSAASAPEFRSPPLQASPPQTLPEAEPGCDLADEPDPKTQLAFAPAFKSPFRLADSPAALPAHAAPLRRHRGYVLALAIAFAVGGAWWLGTRPSPGPAEDRAMVMPPAAAPSATALQAPPPATALVSPAAFEPTLAPAATAPAASPAPAIQSAAPPKRPPVGAARSRERAGPIGAVLESSPSRPRKASETTEPLLAASATSSAQRCSDLVLKSSLESLTADEVTFQKNQCK